jgi:hypothetical protein
MAPINELLLEMGKKQAAARLHKRNAANANNKTARQPTEQQ